MDEKLIKNNKEFQIIIKDLIDNKTVQEMKKYMQHSNTSCFEHCYLVAYYCYCICKRFNLDYKSVTRAAMLHDFFLYDWRTEKNIGGLHAFVHGKIACENACKLFDLSEKEKDIIIKHMWPVTPAFPKSIEGFILTFIDKYCAMHEFFTSYLFKRFIIRYAYIFILFFYI